MITLNTNVDKAISAEAACAILTQQNRLMPIYVDLDRIYEYLYYYKTMTQIQGMKCFRMIKPNEPIMRSITTDEIVSWFKDNNLAVYMPKTKTGMSTDVKKMKDILNMGVANKEQTAILNEFILLSTYTSITLPLGGIITGGIESELLSTEGHRMIELWPRWVPQNTGRFTATDPAFGNLARVIKDIVTVPQGYIMLQADSGQIEPRITYSKIIRDKQIVYLIKLYDDAYYGLLHYVTQSEQDWLSKRCDVKAMEITDDLKAQRTQLKTVGNAVLYGSTDVHGGNKLIANYVKRIGNHPERVKLVKSIEEQIIGGNHTFTTGFGTKVDVRNSSNSKGKYSESQGTGYFNHLVRAAINSYMQGTAADLMRFAVQRADNYLLENAKDSYISMSVHDALYYTINENEVDKLKDDLGGFTAYQVDDWIPIHSEPELGVHRTNSTFLNEDF